MTDIPERRFLPADVIVPPVPEHMIDRGVFPWWADGWTEGYIARQQEVERLNGLRRSSRASRKRYKRDNADLLLRLAERDEQLAASQQANAAMAKDAARYRWLRDNDQDSYVVLRDHDFLKYGVHLDAAIDAAIAEQAND
jgi:hypothetical protein